MTSSIVIDIDAQNEPYWTGLREGCLKFQACSCGHTWLPARALCPACLGHAWQWKDACGNGVIKSWVVYHVAYHPEFKDRLPYNVAIVKLQEGPQLITNIVAPHSQLHIGAKVRFKATEDAEQPLAIFELLEDQPVPPEQEQNQLPRLSASN
ncbi:Zn-ribbon domain-containing OB-fold protein [Ottowia thiooxydans]|uniref:Zn-ribbon domain-containing OB-fold protein n=1 Tax=Ottowia thiooxydans TaxID=219182 RepID=UPI00040E2A7E|nr:OB-fold domain-containing protein [Ottowia thiooxydans]